MDELDEAEEKERQERENSERASCEAFAILTDSTNLYAFNPTLDQSSLAGLGFVSGIPLAS
jgi:hypothetical protein